MLQYIFVLVEDWSFINPLEECQEFMYLMWTGKNYQGCFLHLLQTKLILYLLTTGPCCIGLTIATLDILWCIATSCSY